MRLYNTFGKLINRNVSSYRIDWDAPSKSKIQFAVKQFLKPYWFHHICYEEFPVYGTRMKCDILNLTLKILIEVDGNQHEHFNKFFHGNSRGKYLSSIKRDVAKENWCKLNNIKVLRIYEGEVPNISAQFFWDKFDLTL